MRTFWLYTVARLAILAVAFGLFYVAGARGLLLLALAFGVSLLVSFFALAGMREQLARGVQTRAGRINERIDASASAEDDEAEDDEDDEAADDEAQT